MPVSAWARLPVRRARAPSSDRARLSVPCSLASGERLPDLAEDLALADHHRVQAAGHREQVLHGAVLVVHVQVRGQLVERHARSAGPAARRRPRRRRGTCRPRRRSPPGCRCSRPWNRPRPRRCSTSRSSLTRASPVSTARSSVAIGALLWLSPTTRMLMCATAWASTPLLTAKSQRRARIRLAITLAPGPAFLPLPLLRHADYRATLRVEGEDLQLDRQVDLTHIDAGRHVQHDGREVEDAGHARPPPAGRRRPGRRRPGSR